MWSFLVWVPSLLAYLWAKSDDYFQQSVMCCHPNVGTFDAKREMFTSQRAKSVYFCVKQKCFTSQESKTCLLLSKREMFYFSKIKKCSPSKSVLNLLKEMSEIKQIPEDVKFLIS